VEAGYLRGRRLLMVHWYILTPIDITTEPLGSNMRWAQLLPNAIFPIGIIILGRQAKWTPRQWLYNLIQTIAIFGGGAAIQYIHPILRNMVIFCFFATIARMYWLLGQRSPNTHLRNPIDKCSLGVFMGSGKSSRSASGMRLTKGQEVIRQR
jgi:hypothetical protein